MALEDIFALEEHARAAGAGELGEEALVEEVRRRYREKGGGSLVDLLLDPELSEARRRLTSDERFLAMMHQANEYEREMERLRRHLKAHQALVEEMRQVEELGRIRRAKSQGGQHRDPRRTALIAFIASRLSDSDYLNSSGRFWAWLRRRPQRLLNGVEVDAYDRGLRLTDSSGRSKVITQSTFRRYFTEAQRLHKKAAQ